MVLIRLIWLGILFFLSSCSFDFIRDSQDEVTKDPVYTYRSTIQLYYKENSTKVLNLEYSIYQFPAYIIEREVTPDSFLVTFLHSGQILPVNKKSTRPGGSFGSVPMNFYNEIPPPISFTLHISDKWHSDSIEVFIPIVENIQKLNSRILNATLETSQIENRSHKINLEIDPGIPLQIREAMKLNEYIPIYFSGRINGLDAESNRNSESFDIRYPDQDKCKTQVFYTGKPFIVLTGLSFLHLHYKKQITVKGPQNYNNQPFIELGVEIDFN
ncbi:MAG: hypothetical protein J0L62_02810 [Bacteroidetes bacterium]|nr:hypothetical protein [Bacteroidota bacterium]